MGSLAPRGVSTCALTRFGPSRLNQLHVVGRVKPLPAVVLQPAAPALVVLVLGLQKLLPCGDTRTLSVGFYLPTLGGKRGFAYPP